MSVADLVRMANQIAANRELPTARSGVRSGGSPHCLVLDSWNETRTGRSHRQRHGAAQRDSAQRDSTAATCVMRSAAE